MTRFSRIFFGLLVAVLLVWQLPWGVNYLTVKSEGTPFTLYSEVLGDFAMIRRGGKELEYLDRRGNRYGQRQFDSLLPLFYARQLVADGRFPDSIAGRAVSPREAQAATFVFRSTPQDVNTPVSGIRFLLESMSGRVDLAMPDDAFRLTASGIEFIDMASNTVDTAKSALFTGTMRRKRASSTVEFRQAWKKRAASLFIESTRLRRRPVLSSSCGSGIPAREASILMASPLLILLIFLTKLMASPAA